MPLWPANAYGNSPVITPFHFESMGLSLAAIGGTLASPGSSTWPTANKAFMYRFRVASRRFPVKRLGVVNGGTISGNLDMGIYDMRGRRIVSKGSTAHAGASVTQWLDVTDVDLSPGRDYLMAIAFDNTTATIFRYSSISIQLLRELGAFVQSASFPLPSTITLDPIDATYIPLIAVSSRTF